MADLNAVCTIYFDGACPLYRREIVHYCQQAKAPSIAWLDAVACAESELGGHDFDLALV